MFKRPYHRLERILGYRFKQPALLEQALTHPSYCHEYDREATDNQRLEFLGDAAVGLVVGERLYTMYPDLKEGELTRRRILLTSGAALAEIAREAQLGEFLRMGRGEEQSGGASRPSNLADMLEAILGAAFLDGGIKALHRIVDQIFGPALNHAPEERHEHNPKGVLQERVQKDYKACPEYRIVAETGLPHELIFTAHVLCQGRLLGEGTGPSKRLAEAEAARKALEHFPIQPTQETNTNTDSSTPDTPSV